MKLCILIHARYSDPMYIWSFFNIIILVAGGQPKVEGDQGEPGEALQELGRQKNEMRNAPSMTSST